jgi:hypothetical protein
MFNNRLFVVGDSWAFNYFSKKIIHRKELKPFLNNEFVKKFAENENYYGHWTQLFENVYKVYNYAEPGVSNEDIVHQLSYINDYKDGDRLIIFFTSPSRYIWYDDKLGRGVFKLGSDWIEKYDKYSHETLENQIILRDDFWLKTDIRKNEINFYKKLPFLYSKYKPLLITWDETFFKKVDTSYLIPYNEKWTSIEIESNGKLRDGHMGKGGNYELYKWIFSLLGLNKKHMIKENETKKII